MSHILCIISVLLFVPFPLWASIAIAPTVVELNPQKKIAEIILENKSDTEKLFEVHARHWTQPNGSELYTDTSDLIVLPLSATIKAQSKQKFRLVIKNPAAVKKQQAYRVFFNELAAPRSPKKSGLVFLLNVSIPVFVNPLKYEKSIQHSWSVSYNSKTNLITLTLKNTGTNYFILHKMNVKEAAEFNLSAMKYLLPGTSVEWKFVRNKKSSTEKIQIDYQVMEKKESINLSLGALAPPKK